ncbi:hypothetical protein [Geobacter anodireducens]
MKIKIPLLMLGPYLRIFLYSCMAISGGLAVLFFVCALCTAKRPSTSDSFMEGAMSMLGVALTLAVMTILFHFLGMS